MKKTDTAENVGKHRFELAGLGVAPFKFTGIRENVHKAGDTIKPGGCCDFCFTGIMYEYWIVSADGIRSKVGCDCIQKVGDAGLMQAYKTHPEVRALKRKQASDKSRKVWLKLKAILSDNAALLSAMPHSRGFLCRKTHRPLTRLDEEQWLFDACGAAGRARMLKRLTSGQGALTCTQAILDTKLKDE